MTDAGETGSVARLQTAAGRLAFGDRWGLVLFLTALCFVGLYWRAGVFITDTATIVRALEAVSQGRLAIEPATEGHFAAPGAVVSDGYVYGRNYGQVLLALPALWALDLLGAVADLRVGLTALWHLGLLALALQLGRLYERERLAAYGGSFVVLASFLLNFTLATSFGSVPRYLLALQVSTAIAAALLAVLTYRLVRLEQDSRVAIAAGLASVLVLPVGFWAQLPKRHVLVATILLGILYLFARSRSAERRLEVPGYGPVPAYRAGAYALVGLLAWIHAAEALFVLMAFAAVDLPTAPSNDVRSLGVVGVVFAVSLLPFFVTNGLISGDVLEPTRALDQANPAGPLTTDFLRESGGGGGGGFPGSAIFGKLFWVLGLVWGQVDASLASLQDPTVVYRTWIRSGALADVGMGGVPEFRAVNLTVLESMPLLGGAVAVAGTVTRRGRGTLLDGLRPTDLLAAAIVLAFVLLYSQRLPIHVQVTVRYLLPVYPLFLVLLARQRILASLVTEDLRSVLWAYAGVVLLGTQVLLAGVVLAGLSVSEAAQLHAIAGLAAAVILAVATLAAQFDGRFRPLAAGALGLAAGAGTAFVLLTGLAYFSFIGPYVLPASQAVADLVGGI